LLGLGGVVATRARAARRARGEARLAVLTPEQYQVRFEQAKAELLQGRPGMGSLLAKEGSALHDKIIRPRIIRFLATQPMDLAVIDGQTDPDAIRRKLGLQNLPL